jgi:hypothetical protein
MNAAMLTAMREDMDRLRGRLLETVEAIGLPQTQEDAVKRIVRRTTFDSQGDLEANIRRLT